MPPKGVLPMVSVSIPTALDCPVRSVVSAASSNTSPEPYGYRPGIELKVTVHTYSFHTLGWQSSRIERSVRSTLKAEAYSCAEAVDVLLWVRATVQAVLFPHLKGRN